MKKIIETIKSIDWKSVKPATYVRAIMAVIAVINYVLTAMGKQIIVLPNETVTLWVNIILMAAFTLYPMWKNNSFTRLAQLADTGRDVLKDGKITEKEYEDFIKNFGTSVEYEE